MGWSPDNLSPDGLVALDCPQDGARPSNSNAEAAATSRVELLGRIRFSALCLCRVQAGGIDVDAHSLLENQDLAIVWTDISPL
jgi:hypothetical protein